MKIERKHIIAGAIGLVTITGALLYLQYKKLMNYVIKLKTLKVKTLTANLISFDIFLNFTNNSNLAFDIVEQDYKVFLNGEPVVKMLNRSINRIAANKTNGVDTSVSVIGVNVAFNPTKVLQLLGKNWISILTKPETVKLKVEVKLKASSYGFKFSIPYVYEGTLKSILDSKKEATV